MLIERNSVKHDPEVTHFTGHDRILMMLLLKLVIIFKTSDRCTVASVGIATLKGSEPRQALPQETVAVGQTLLLGNHA